MSSLARVRNSGSLFHSNLCKLLIFAGDLAAVRIIGVSARRELIVADGDAALVIDDKVAKKYDDNKYDAAFSIILVAVK